MEQSVVFFDIDNTLLDFEQVVPDSAKEALVKLRKNGHKAFINTGRSRAFVQAPQIVLLPLDGLVCGCGTHIEIFDRPGEGHIVYEETMPFDQIARVREVLAEQEVPVIFEGAEYHWLNPEGFQHDSYMERVWNELGDRAKYPEEIREGDRINKFSGVITEKSDVTVVRTALENEFDFLFHTDTIFEAIPKGTGKAYGIKKLCELTGMSHDVTYAIGDSVNDLDMLTFVKHGICMGNGTEDAKTAAEYVTSDLHDDGIRNALLYYGLI